MRHVSRKTFFTLLLAIVGANYLAQIPYYIHQYYTPYKLLPSPLGVILLGMTLIWFVAAVLLLQRGKRAGYYLLVGFLTLEFLFYLQTQVSQWLISHQILLHVYHPDGLLLFIVFGIGYVNFIADIYFIGYVVYNRTRLIS